MKNHSIILGIAILVLLPGSLFAQIKRSQDFKNRYKLEECVILSRHSIRAPLSTKGSLLEQVTTHEWTPWTANASELTSRGGALENQFGLYFRKWVVDAGLFLENATPSTDELNVYANSMQRCIATAHYFITAFLPVANVQVNHRFTPARWIQSSSRD